MIRISSIWEAPTISADFDFTISILDPNKKDFSLTCSKHLVVHFEDTEHPTDIEFMEMLSGVKKIMAWVSTNNITMDSKVLVPCHAGVSRSSAIAWLILIKLGMDPREAFQKLFADRPTIWPNTTVMDIGDSLLGMNGSLSKLAAEINAEISRRRVNSSYMD